ncbi:hypothetical protein GCM10009610_63940 [Pseudonocardia xinjiangensis]
MAPRFAEVRVGSGPATELLGGHRSGSSRLAACPDTYPACYRPMLEVIDMGRRWTGAGRTLPLTV